MTPRRPCIVPFVPQVLSAGGYVNDLELTNRCVDWLKVQTTAEVFVTGFTPGCEDRTLCVTNEGPDDCTLKHLTISNPGNRIFLADEEDTPVPAGYSLCLRYDVQTSPDAPAGVWREVSKFAAAGGAPAFGGVHLRLANFLALPANAPLAVAWDTVDFDSGGFFSSGSPTLVTIPADGYYAVGARLQITTNWTTADGTLCFIQLWYHPLVGGDFPVAQAWAAPLVANLNAPYLFVFDVLHLVAGEHLYVKALQNTPNPGFVQGSRLTNFFVWSLQGPAGPPGPPGTTEALTVTLTNRSGGDIAAGTPVTMNSVGTGIIPADGTPTGIALGLTAADAADLAPAEVTTGGTVTLADWTASAGGASLVPATNYFLGPAGTLVVVPPSSPGAVVQYLGRAVGPQTLEFQPGDPIIL